MTSFQEQPQIIASYLPSSLPGSRWPQAVNYFYGCWQSFLKYLDRIIRLSMLLSKVFCLCLREKIVYVILNNAFKCKQAV